MDLEQYLYDNYKTVEQLENGGYYCEDQHRNGLYIPPNRDGSVKLLGYLPGVGGYYDSEMLKNIIHSDNPPEYACTISYTAYSDNAENLLTDTFDVLTGKLNMDVTEVCQMSFSDSGGRGFTSLNKLLTEHPELSAWMVVNNTDKDEDPIKHPERYMAIRQNNTPIIYVDPGNFKHRERRVLEGLKEDYNMFILESSSGNHPRYNRDILYNRLVDFIFGYKEELGTGSDSSSKPVIYNLVSFDKETGQKLPIDIENLVSTEVNGVSIPNLKQLLNPGDFTISNNLVKNDLMGVLGNLTNLKLKYRGGEVSSKYSYVESTMNSIRQQVRSSGYLSGYGTQNFRSTEGIPGCIGKYIDAYFNLVNTLLNDLSLQTEAVLSYAQAMIDMDKHLAEGASDLGTIVATPISDDAKPKNDYNPPKDTPDYYGGNTRMVSTTPKTREIKFDFKDNRRAVLETNGENIVSFRYYYNYKNSEAAIAAKSDLMKSYKGKDYFDRMEVKGNGINVYIKKEYLNSKSLNDIQKELLKGATMVNG